MKNISVQRSFLFLVLLNIVNPIRTQPKDPSVCLTLKAEDKRKPLDPMQKRSPSRRKRQRVYKKKTVTMRDMTYEEMKEVKNKRIQEKNIEAAIKYAEKMIPLCKDMHEQRDLTLELADLLFDYGQLEKAGKKYQEFVKLYPGTDIQAIEKASYRMVLCSFYSILDSQRDQTKTQETIEFAATFLERAEIFNQHTDEVRMIQQKCYERLVESDMNIVNFYLMNERFNAAQVRIDNIRKEFTPKVADLEPRLLTIEVVLAEKQGKHELAAEKQLVLHDKYPTFSQVNTLIAQNKNNFVNKF